MNHDETVLRKLADEGWRTILAPKKEADADAGTQRGKGKKKGAVLTKDPTRKIDRTSYVHIKCMVSEVGYTLVATDLVGVWACDVDFHSLSNEKDMYNPQLDVDIATIPSMLEQHFLTLSSSQLPTTSILRSIDDEGILHLECACAIDFYKFVWEFVCYPMADAGSILRDYFIGPLLLMSSMQARQLRALKGGLCGLDGCDPIAADGTFDESAFNERTLGDKQLRKEWNAPSLWFLEDAPARMMSEWLGKDVEKEEASQSSETSQKEETLKCEEKEEAGEALLTPPAAAPVNDVVSPSKQQGYVESYEELQRRREIEEALERKKRKRDEDAKSKKKRKRIKLV